MNYGGSNGVNETEMFLVERTMLANSANSTTLRSKREFRWIGLVKTVAFEFIQILCSCGCFKREFRWIGLAETVAFEFIQILCSYGCCKREFRWLALPSLLYWSPYRLLSVSILWRRCTWVTAEDQKISEAGE